MWRQCRRILTPIAALALLLIALNFLADAILAGYGAEVMLGLDCEQGRVPARGRGR